MLTVLATVGLAGAYALLWRHAHLKGRRLRAEQARARRLARRDYGLWQIRTDPALVFPLAQDVRRPDVLLVPWETLKAGSRLDVAYGADGATIRILAGGAS